MNLNAHDARNMSRVLRHRLRNSASGIHSATTLLSQELAGRLAPEEMEYFPLILDVCDQVNEMTNRLSLLFDELPGGAPRAIDAIVGDAVASLHSRIPTAPVRVKIDRSAADARVGTDQAVILAVHEVLTNAAEAAPGQPIELHCRASHDGVALAVTDRGPGVAPEDMGNLFRPFFTRRERHLGVGLAIARRAAGQAGGRIQAAAAAGGGLCVELTVERTT
jgi:C4-dicarboxylate-specific signal transduction histidine kinase